MQTGIPSRTALATAFARALHVVGDDAPPVLDDRIAFQLLPLFQQRFLKRQASLRPLRRAFAGGRASAFNAMRTQVVVRARYAEDTLAEARKHGAGRYVVLGAGLDTFALRQAAPHIDVVEIDFPATQEWKRQLLSRRGLEPPASVRFMPVDFEREQLGDGWMPADAPDFISWLGTSYYLSREAIQGTLTTLAELTAPGSELVVDYWSERPGLVDVPLLWGTRMAVAMQGEPMRSFFESAEIEALATSAGWQPVENLTPSAQAARYLARRRDRLAVPSFAHLLRLRR